jgi:wobble nucleotide-excising tRNase
MLRDAGFQGFEVRPRKEQIVHPDGSVEYVEQNPVINYEVVRTDTGEVATDLSEGEKNFIAFLYFQQLVFGSASAEGDGRQKIVVIDDPVSSMDSSALFIIGEQVRKMVEICRNNADNRNPVVKGNFIKQIFILTHNAYFHREIAYPHADRYDFVSFYLVKKRENRSSVTLWRKHDPDCPTEWMNVNPVKNSYAALWEEYKEVTTVIPLMNAIRRILEHYFLQLCGYDGSQLRKRILEDNKFEYTHDEGGHEDYTKFDMATSMLSYIAASTYGVNDGFHYVDDVIDIQQCRDTFQMIFRHMDQEQHYKMMMGIK